MKRFIVFLLVLVIAFGGAFFWWQQNAHRIITEKVQQIAYKLFVNPNDLDVQHAPVALTGLRQARIPNLTVIGHNLELRDGLKVSSAKIVLADVDIAGPPFRMVGVGGGYYIISTTDDAVTAFIRQRGFKVAPAINIPLDTLSIHFAKTTGTLLTAEVHVPLVKNPLPLTAHGALIPAGQGSQINFLVNKVKIEKFSFGAEKVADTLDIFNPVVDISHWPVTSEIVGISTGEGTITVRGKITGIRQSLF